LLPLLLPNFHVSSLMRAAPSIDKVGSHLAFEIRAASDVCGFAVIIAAATAAGCQAGNDQKQRGKHLQGRESPHLIDSY